MRHTQAYYLLVTNTACTPATHRVPLMCTHFWYFQGEHRGSYGSVTVMVEEGAGVTFLGHVVAKEITNTRSLFRNSGSME